MLELIIVCFLLWWLSPILGGWLAENIKELLIIVLMITVPAVIAIIV